MHKSEQWNRSALIGALQKATDHLSQREIARIMRSVSPVNPYQPGIHKALSSKPEHGSGWDWLRVEMANVFLPGRWSIDKSIVYSWDGDKPSYKEKMEIANEAPTPKSGR